MDKMKFETPNMTSENIDKIGALFPNCVTEMRDENGKLKRGINFEMLKLFFGEQFSPFSSL